MFERVYHRWKQCSVAVSDRACRVQRCTRVREGDRYCIACDRGSCDRCRGDIGECVLRWRRAMYVQSLRRTGLRGLEATVPSGLRRLQSMPYTALSSLWSLSLAPLAPD